MRKVLPRSLDELVGLRAARYRRESTEEQGTKYGPAEQDAEIDRFMAKHGLLDTGIVFTDHHSGWQRSEARPEFLAMMAAAAEGQFDVLVVAYFSRFSRNVRQALEAHDILHRGGVAIAFADEHFVSSDEDAWEDFIDEAVSAEKYSRKLSRRIKNTLRAKFERHGDQAGTAGLGFCRTPQPEARLAIDPVAMQRVVQLFEEYAVGNVTYAELGERHGLKMQHVRSILTNRIYNGWAVRERRSPREAWVAAPWRDNPPVSDELWTRVEEVRRRRVRTAGRLHPRRAHLLAKILWCPCGRPVRAETHTNKQGVQHRRYRHEPRCGHWRAVTRIAETFELPIVSQVSQLRVDESTLARLRERGGEPIAVDTTLQRRAIERELERKAADHAARRITTEAYLAEHARLTAELDRLSTPPTPSSSLPEGDAMVRFLRDLKASWELGGEWERAKLVQSVYDKIVVNDREVVEVELTEDAKRHGLAWALPEQVKVVLARPAGLEPTAFCSGGRRSIR
jgi:DNA invertase Pin-like site-specific DNA recombinase